ncbi:hypothetical protein MBLNU459_g2090t1 [Dothideomycetes sp. NU459]
MRPTAMRGRTRTIGSFLRSCQFSGSAQRPVARQVPQELVELRRFERKSLYELREQIDDFIRRIEDVQSRSSPGPDPETLLNQKTGTKQYISTERYRVGSDVCKLGASIIAHSRELQEHCKDMEQEPYRDWVPGDHDIFTEQAQQSNVDFLALEQEEKVRKLEIQARLKDVVAQVHAASRALELAKRSGPAAAYAYLNRAAKKGVFTLPDVSTQTETPDGKTSEVVSKDATSASWEDFDQYLAAQLKNDEAASEGK